MKKALVWAQQRRPYRVYKIYSAAGGNLLAAGMSFQALFATFAAVWVGFSFSGIYLHERPELKSAIIDFINTQIPDLIRSGGPIDPHVLDSATSLGWTGGIAVLVVLYTAINWLNYVRTAVRTIFALPPSRLNFVLLKLYDLVLALGYGIFVVLTAALTVVVTNLANLIFPAIGIIDENGWGKIAFQIGGLVIVYFFDVVMLALMMNVLSGVPIPLRNLRDGVLLGALALTLLKVAGSFILTRTDSNPLLASFTVFIGLLIYFNFASRIYLFATSWVALSMQDEQVEVRDLGWIVPHRHSSD